MAQSWAKYIPDSATPATPKPLECDQLLQESIPLYKVIITTAEGGVSVSLSAAIQAVLSTKDNYAVSLIKQTVNADGGGGELQVPEATKATTGFKVTTTGTTYGEKVLVIVWWLPS